MREATLGTPVLVSTLCRAEHFERCLESLAANTWALRTPVYVALDYPAKIIIDLATIVFAHTLMRLTVRVLVSSTLSSANGTLVLVSTAPSPVRCCLSVTAGLFIPRMTSSMHRRF